MCEYYHDISTWDLHARTDHQSPRRLWGFGGEQEQRCFGDGGGGIGGEVVVWPSGGAGGAAKYSGSGWQWVLTRQWLQHSALYKLLVVEWITPSL